MSTKLTIAQLKKLQSSPAAFRSVLMIDVDGTQRRLSEVIEPWQRADFEKLDSGLLAVIGAKVTNPTLRFWAERPRGHSKSSDLAIAVAFLMFASTKPLSGILAAVDADQAAIVKEAVSRLIAANPWLTDFVKVQAAAIINPHTGSVCKVITSDAPSSYGALPSFVIYDELAHSAKRDLFDSLLSAAAKKERCLLAVITNAGFCDSWVWNVREQVRRDPDWTFSRLERPCAKWITEARLQEQQRLLPMSAYFRLWENRWASGEGDAISEADIAASLTLTGPTLAREQGFAHCGGLDLSVTSDLSAFAIIGVNVGWVEKRDRPQRKVAPINRALIDCGLLQPRRNEEAPEEIHHKGDGRIKLCDLQVWNPRDTGRIDFEQIENAIVEAHKRYEFCSLGVDPFQSEALTQRLQRRGIPIYSVAQVGSVLRDTCMATLDAFRERRLDLYRDARLLKDLHSARLVERGYGIRMESPRNEHGHGDLLSSLAMALLCSRKTALRSSTSVPGRLVCWPTAETAA